MKYQKNKIDNKELRYTFCFLLLAGSLITACKKFVQIPAPATQLVNSTVFNNAGTATSAITNIYQAMYKNSESFNMAWQTGMLGDELTNYNQSIPYKLCYTNGMIANNTAAELTFGPWNTAYNYIYQANAVIASLQQYSNFSPAIKNQLTGEALFIRSFWNFYLTNCYGDIPLVTTTNYTTNASLSRTPQKQVYQQIITDLKQADGLLNSNFIDASDTAVTTSDRTRPNKWAAEALLARVYLCYGNLTNDQSNYTAAETEATNVIGRSALFSLVSDLNGVFLVNSTEAIWQLGIPLPNYYGNTPDGNGFILFGTPSHQAVSPQLLSAFEPGDRRKTDWIGSYTTTDGTNITYYFPYKYKVSSTSPNASTITEENVMLRLSEQYLILAEAKANLGDATALNDLNIIRNRAGLVNYTGATDKASLLAAILHERQVELFTEWGARWFDLIRTGNINSVMGSPGNVSTYKNGGWQPYKALFPIPQSERNTDPNLSQNTGY